MSVETPDMEAVKKYLARLLAGPLFVEKLAALDDAKGSVGEERTPLPGAVLDYEAANTNGLAYPVCEVVGVRTDYSEPENETKRAGRSVVVNWTQVGDTEHTITRHIERLVEATARLLWNYLIPELGARVIVISEDLSELMPGRDRPFVKGSQTLLAVVTYAL